MRRRTFVAFVISAAGGVVLPVARRLAGAVETLQYRGTIYATPTRGDIVMAGDLTRLRTQVNDVRARYGLAAFQWTDPVIIPQETIIKAVHVQELRQAIHASKSLLDQIQARPDTTLLANGLQQRTMPTMRDYAIAWGIAVTLEAGAVLLIAGGKITQTGLLTIAEGLAAGTVSAQVTFIVGGFYVTLTGAAVIALGIGAIYIVWRGSQGPHVPVQSQPIRIEVSPDGLGWDVFEIGGW